MHNNNCKLHPQKKAHTQCDIIHAKFFIVPTYTNKIWKFHPFVHKDVYFIMSAQFTDIRTNTTRTLDNKNSRTFYNTIIINYIHTLILHIEIYIYLLWSASTDFVVGNSTPALFTNVTLQGRRIAPASSHVSENAEKRGKPHERRRRDGAIAKWKVRRVSHSFVIEPRALRNC